MKLTKKLEKENVELRDAARRRAAELRQKNFELKIEAALEKVRIVAMGMKKPADMLKICKTIAQQMRSLGLKEVRNVQTAVINPGKGTYLNFEYYAKHNKLLTTEVNYTDHPMTKAFVKQMLSGPNGSFKKSLKGKKVQEWYKFQKTTNQFADKYLAKASSLNYYWYSLGPVALGVSSYEPLSDAGQEMLKRFRKVFELSYRRYLDIEKAEAQAREAQIQLALEKVRARTMAMQKSDELIETTYLVFQQLKELGETAAQISIGIINEEGGYVELSATVHGDAMLQTYRVSIDEPFMMKKALRTWKAKQKTLRLLIRGEQLKKYNRWRNSVLEKKIDFPEKQWIANVVFFSKGMLTFSSDKEVSAETLDLLIRFAAVFDQTYTRFLDLQKAEAQARESQIQLALERVRARTMAMQKSDELSETAAVLFQQFKELGDSPIQITIGIFNEKENVIEFRITSAEGLGSKIDETFNASLDEPTLMRKIFVAWKANKKSAVISLTGRELTDWIKYRSSISGRYPYDSKIGSNDTRFVAVGLFSKGIISFSKSEPVAEETIQILERFAGVFDLTYTRFLDLQKAEAQARESQIQLALERVRSRTMAMQHSEELAETATILFEQFHALGEVPDRIAIEIVNEKENVFEVWATQHGGSKMSQLLKFSLNEPHVMRKMYVAWKEQTKSITIDLQGNELEEYFQFLKNSGAPVQREIFGKRRVQNVATFSKGILTIITPNEQPAETINILERFASVFDGTYTRFLDLQKAEAQAREAEIELALERVRAKSMAMQRSDELQGVVDTVFARLNELHVELYTAIIIIFSEGSKDIVWWMQNRVNQQYSRILIKYADKPYLRHLFEAREKGEEMLSRCYINGEKKEFYDYLFEHTDLRQVPAEQKKFLLESEFATMSVALAKNIGIHITSYSKKSFSDGEKEILKRFAKVFDQSYTRFLDLQKAEAQARESQIQLALERVRARTMAMQRSDELRDAASLLFRQLEDLGVKSWSSGFNIWQVDGRSATINMCNPDGSIATPYHLPHTEDIFFIRICEARQRGDDLLVMETGGKELEETYNYMFSLPEVKKVLGGMEDTGFQIPKFQVNHCAFFSQGYLMFITYEPVPEMWDVFKRFAKVFEQTYTRFLDLQTAEAQARESQIQLALERVRARTMAMQKSEELQDTALLLFQQVKSLGVPPFACGFNIWDEDRKAATAWMAREDALQPPFKTSSSEDVFLKILEAAQRGESLFVEEQGGEKLEEHYGYMTSIPVFRDVVQKMSQAGLSIPTFQIIHCAFFSHGYLMFISYEPVPEAHDIFKRFAKVFEQTYTRFLDLQKAEVQARESKIEAALERVRSKAMAMHRSEDLAAAVTTVFEEFGKLNVAPLRCGIGIIDGEKRSATVWTTVREEQGMVVQVSGGESSDIHPLLKGTFEAWTTQSDFSYVLEGDDLAAYYNTQTGENFKLPESQLVLSPTKIQRQYYHFATFHAGGLFAFADSGFTEEVKQVMKRFANVFDLTYKRFLDLQKAEAQAREAQIEAALEKVRSRTMAMQRSDELSETAAVLFQEFKKLGEEDLLQITIGIYNEPEGLMEFRVTSWAGGGEQINEAFNLSIEEPTLLKPAFNAWKEQRKSIVIDLSGKELEDWLHYRNAMAGVTVRSQDTGGRRVVSFAFFSKGHISFSSAQPKSPETLQLLERFAGVFDLTYTRFLDLQKAEAQARESQIQLAMERVRARTMAMQRSDELAEAASLLFKQVSDLGIKAWSTAFQIWNTDDISSTAWASAPDGSIQTPFRLPYNEDIFFKQIYGAKQRGEDFFVMESHGKELEETYKYMFNLPGVKKYFDDAEDSGFSIPIFQVTHCAFFSYGYLMFITYEHVPEMWDIFKRFAKVFEQTYTRFLDLQKAEAQAREAQIETALEKVRSRTMGMQKSDELKDVIQVVYEQFIHLKILVEHAGFIMDYKARDDMHIWLADKHAVPFQVTIPYFDCAHWNSFNESKQKGKDFFANHLSFEEKNKFYQDLFRLIPGVPEETLDYYFSCPGLAISTVLLENVGLYIENFSGIPYTDDENVTLMRFGKVFQQTYTRFLDLQKAEAQAREAKIEAALEKIRSTSLAMHRSEEINAVVVVLFEKLKELGLVFDGGAAIHLFDAQSRDATIWVISPELSAPISNNLPYDEEGFVDNPIILDVWKAKDTGEHIVNKYYSFEDKNRYFRYVFKHNPDMSPALREFIMNASSYTATFIAEKNSLLGANSWSEQRFSEADVEVLKRVARVFEQAYIRFLDLQKAEAQAREAQIEAALERVRAKAMAMHKTEDLNFAVAVVFEELEKLDLGVLRCGLSVLNKEKRIGDVWATSTTAEGSAVQVSGDESFDIHPLLAGAFDAWLRQEDFEYVLEGEDLTNYYKAVKAARFQLPESQFISSDTEFKRQYCYVAVYHAGGLFAFQETEFRDEAKRVMKRFANVFDLTYKRFIDLQKAEAQAREAQIEAALERVRSRTMAMHRSQEIGDIVGKIFSELSLLDLVLNRVLIWTFNDEERYIRWWSANPEVESNAESYRVDYNDTPVFLNYLQAWQKRLPMYLYTLSGDTKKNWEDHLFTNTELSKLPMPVRKGMREEGTIFTTSTTSDYGLLMVGSFEPLSDTNTDIIQRFGRVFQQSYTRYLDVQKAEAQAREAQIEAAMEKVRSRAMAMQQADELVEVAQLLRKEMGLLGVEELETSSIYIHHEDAGTTECWYAIQDAHENKLVTDHMTIRLNDTWVGRQMLAFYRSDEKQTSIQMQGDNRKEWINYCSAHSKVLSGFYGENIPDRTYHLYKFPGGYMGAASPGDISAESWDLLYRATSVFSLAYTRFNDLQLAEAQAREATIEAAMERVRAKAMAMHNTNDLSSASSTAFAELRKLGINPIRFGVGLLSKESRKALLYSATSSAEGESLALVGWVMLKGHPVLEDIYESWTRNEDIFPELSGEQLQSYYEQLLSGLSVPSVNWQTGDKQFGHFFPFSVGCLYAWAEKPYNDAEIKILKRFASIIDLTFRRYMDLQKSEANAREAVKQAALDRIRADIASMRTVSDLDRITPLIWNELTILGVPFIRCGVFLMDESQRLIHTFLSTPDGKAIGAFHIPYDTPGNLQRVLAHWHAKKRYSDHWDEEAFIQFAHTLVQQGAMASPDQYLKAIPKGGFNLHFLPFLQGMLYVGNTVELDEQQINLVQSVAEAFSTAYARYEDFNRLEAAKHQIEKTLVDLKQTQQQLIQSEKMASLGELTAGIAHEIQNPLNFVNNFSEVSSELLDEMKNELATGNRQQAIEIADDVKQNLEKILHHGKRADAIVKGMLQHSRASTGQKELTDINALADEYLRLAYHGLRAKDKTFNAKFEIDLDKTIEKINVVPQEIGRVILNLINNAFYTVTEKKRQLNGAYEPTVLVSTRKLDDKIEIKVKDNGNGIPQRVMEKIFQPFFTTKPTGQGTGLGLSLSYDIVTKGHGGELRVETMEGQGSEFIIQLPA